jgi:4-hydroxyphenylpyruvate dioxygenase
LQIDFRPVRERTVSANPLGLKRLHHAEFWVGNAKQAAYFYRKAFGFSQRAYSGLETGSRDTASYLLQQNQVRFVLTSALHSGSPVAAHVARHGDGVRDLAFEVRDADAAYETALQRGARSAQPPRTL